VNNQRNTIADGLSRLNARQQAFLSFLGAERLKLCCCVFQSKNGQNLQVFSDRLETFFELLLNSKIALDFGMVMRELENAVPTQGNPLSTQAQSALICLISAFDLWSSSGKTTFRDSADATVNALDNYTYFIKTKFKDDTDNPSMYPLLERELQWQLALISRAVDPSKLSPEQLINYRVENLQYAIPAAI
jgi:hypothetical protein